MATSASTFASKHGINPVHTPNCFELLSRFSHSYDSLIKSIKEEKGMEAEEVNVPFTHKIKHFKEWNSNCSKGVKIGTPTLICKIDSPFKPISPENLPFLYGNFYPEKWNDKNCTELLLFRTFAKKMNFPTLSSSQQDCISICQEMMNMDHSSGEMGTYWKMAESLVTHEEEKLSLLYLGVKSTDSILCNKPNIDLKKETLQWAWIVDIFEMVNKNIMYESSMRQGQKEAKPSQFSFFDGRRIKTQYFPIGASINTIEFTNGRFLYLFISSTVCGYYYEGSPKMLVGRPEMLQYVLYCADNMLTLNIYEDYTQVEEEKPFIRYYKSLFYLGQEERMSLGSLYEGTCLLMSDYKNMSSAMPILDNIIESITTSPTKTEELLSACNNAPGYVCIKMSALAKTLVIAETNPLKGLSRYTTRTNRDHSVNKNTLERLRCLFRKKVIITYIKKHGKVPQLLYVPEELMSALEIMAAKGNYNKGVINELSLYRKLRLGKFLDVGAEMNLQSRIIDKACCRDTYSTNNNSVKAIQYYIENDMNKIGEIPIKVNKQEYKKNKRIVEVIDRFESKLQGLREFFIVRLAEKEKEQKTAARFFGIASFKLKLWVSRMMELIKRAMKLLPGQMMTMTDDERREVMYNMSTMLLKEDSYSLFLDYSGHNTSQRPENTTFILEEIANMYGYIEGSIEYEELTSLAFLFSNIHVIHEDAWSDDIYYSYGQLGAIEGWFGGLWGIQSQLMLEDMFSQMGIREYIGTTYSDDSCGVFIQKNMDSLKLDEIIRNVQNYGRNMGLLVKLSQTQVTNGRCSMLKEHYYEGYPVDMSIKRYFSITPNSSLILGDTLEKVTLIDSGYTSSCYRALDIRLQTTLRNFRALKVVGSELKKLIKQLPMTELDPRYLGKEHEYEVCIRQCIKLITSGLQSSIIVPNPHADTMAFMHFHRDNRIIKELFLVFFYGPYTTFGYALTPMPDSLISGYSLSNVKRISYIQGISSYETTVTFGKLIQLSGNALSYIDNSFPLTGGRKDTKLLLKEAIKNALPFKVHNPELLNFIKLRNENEGKEFKANLVRAFQNCFSSRIVSKFLEESIYNYFDEILSKIDNAATMKMLLGGKQMMKIIDKAWKQNHKIKLKLSPLGINNYQDLIMTRRYCKKHINLEEINIKFLEIEEVPLLGKVHCSKISNMFQPIYKGVTKLTESGHVINPPSRTHMNIAKFDKEIGVEGMFEHKLVFKAYDLVRYTKWLIMELEKFSENTSVDTISNLVSICNSTLGSFSDATYEQIEEYVVAPKGGRYFHRALTAGFNPKTGDLSSNLKTSKYDMSGIDQLIFSTGGEDNNLNMQYLITSTRVCLSIANPRPYELMPLTLNNDILPSLRDVTFSLEGLKRIEVPNRPKINIASVERIKTRGKLYYNYSSYVSHDEDMKDKFINHVHIMKEKEMSMESSFHAVNSYMQDQMILSPDLISNEVLEGLVGKENLATGRLNYFDEFYRYFKGLNVVKGETPARAVIRGLLYQELFKINEQNANHETWVTEIVTKGYSPLYRNSLLRLFVLSCALVYQIEDTEDNKVRIHVRTNRTLMNARQSFNRIREGKGHFYIKDKRISETILYAFPTLGYVLNEVAEAARDLCYEIDGMEFEQLRMGSYYLEKHQQETSKEEGVNYGYVNYNEMIINPLDFSDAKGLDSALKAFEMACHLEVSPQQLSSPTMSAVYPSALGLLDSLLGSQFITPSDKIIELCAGRGDFHLAMSEKDIAHTSLSREDGFNLIFRIPGMKSKKVNFNCFRQEEYIKYFDHDIILMDISHITNKSDCLSNLIGDLKRNKKKFILRANGMTKFINQQIIESIMGYEVKAYIPDMDSPGYVYVSFDFNKPGTLLEESKIRGYDRSLLTTALTSRVGNAKLNNIFDRPGILTRDQTKEIISDHTLLQMLGEVSPTYVAVNEELKDKIQRREDFLDHTWAYIDTKLYEEVKKFVTRPRKTLATRGEGGCKNLLEIARKEREKNSDTIIEIKSYVERKNLTIISGVKDCPSEELYTIVNNILSQDANKKICKECWKLILNTSGNQTLTSSDDSAHVISLQKLASEGIRTINNMYAIASQAVLAFRTNRVEDGLLRCANLSMLGRRKVLKHKDKTTRTNVLVYKLLINRIKYLFNLYPGGSWWAGISYQDYDDLWMKRLQMSNEQEKLELTEKIKNYPSLEEFFKEDTTFSFLSCLTQNLESMSKNVEDENTSFATNPVLQMTISNLFGDEVTEEVIEKNKSLNSYEALMEELGASAVYEAWGDIEEDFDDY